VSGSNFLDQFIEIVDQGKVEKAARMVDRLLQENYTVQQIVYEGLVKGLDMVGQKLDEGEYFLPDLVTSGEVAKIVLGKLKPHFAKDNLSLGTVVAGTVRGDVHDIGLNLVALTLEGSGFKVINLGVNTSKDSFIKAIREENANILAMSALLTTTMSYMKEVVQALEENNLRDQVKVIVGGAPLSAEYAAAIGADAFGASARDAVLSANAFVASK
jgi:methylmalonyl-CoA mutase cobalamin-binding domain/chain